MSNCILDFSVEYVAGGGLDDNFIEIKITEKKLVEGVVSTNVSNVTYNDILGGQTALQQMNNDMISYWNNNSYCIETTNVNVSSPSLPETPTLLDYMAQKNELLKNQNELIAENNRLLATSINSNAISKAINKQTEVQNFHGNIQTNKNLLESEKLDFQINGYDDLKDTDGNKILPIKEKAKYHAEKRIDVEKENKIDYGSLLNGDNSLEELDDDSANIMKQAIEYFVGSIDVTKIDKNGEA